MAIVYKQSVVFQVTTVAPNPTYAVSHTGGWTESWWSTADPFANPAMVAPALTSLINARANLLPAQAAVIGLRVQKYNMQGNFLATMGAQAKPYGTPGRAGIVTDLPQVALQLVVSPNGSPNSANMTLRCIPDIYMAGGEFAPDPTYAGFLTTFRNQVTASGFGFVGRDKSQASVRILSASAADGMLLDAIPGTGLVAGDWVRLNRCFDDAGKPLVGPYKLSINPVGNVIRLIGWTETISKPSGTLRRDQMVFCPYNTTGLRRAVVKKIGSPFEKYRGRQTRKRG